METLNFKMTVLKHFFIGILLCNLIIPDTSAMEPFLNRQKKATPLRYNVGGIFQYGDNETPAYVAFIYAVTQRAGNNPNSIALQSKIAWVNDISDSFQVTSALCQLLTDNVVAVFGPLHPSTIHAVESITTKHNLLYFTHSDPHHFASQSSLAKGRYIIKLKPRSAAAVVDFISQENWHRVLYLYDTKEALFRLRMLFEHSNNRHAGLSADARRLSDYKQTEGVLQYINEKTKNSKKHIILDLMSRVSKRNIFDQIFDIKLDRMDYHYLLIEIDQHEMNLTKLVNGGVNFTTFCFVDYERPLVKNYIANVWSQTSRKQAFKTWMDTEEPTNMFPYAAALIEDGVELLMQALNKTRPLSTQNWSSPSDEPCVPLTNTPYTAKQLLPTIIQMGFDGLSGRLQFDENGFRYNYTIDIYEARVKSSYSKIGTWSDTAVPKRLNIDRTEEPVVSMRTLSINRKLIVTSIKQAPFLDVIYHPNGTVTYEGFCVDLVHSIARIVNFTFEFRLVKDGKFGNIVNESWNGMIGELVDNVADLAVAPLTISASRERVVDFSTPFMEVGLSVMFQRSEKVTYPLLTFMEPLSQEIWMCIAFAYLGVSVVLFLVSRFNPYEWGVPPEYGDPEAKATNEFSIFNSFWFSLSAFMQQGGDISPKSLSGRIVGGVWWFFTLIIVSSYTANLAAYLTVERMSSPIQSYTDLAKQTKIKYGVVNGGSSKDFFRDSNMDVFKKMWQFMDSNPSVFVDTIEEGFKRVNNSNRDYAFLLESTMNEYYNQMSPCKTIKIGTHLDSGKGYGIATPTGSDLRDQINLAVLELKEKNNITQLKLKWWKGSCEDTKKAKSAVTNSQSLPSVRGLFYLLIAGLCVGLLLSIFEFLYNCALEAKRKKRDFYEVFREMTYLSAYGKLLPANNQEDICALKSRYIQEKVEYSF